MPEERRHRLVSTQCCAVDLDKLTAYHVARFLELVDPFCQMRLASARWPHEQNRGLGSYGHLLDSLYQSVEIAVARLDARFQKRNPFALLLPESRGYTVILGQIQIYYREIARCVQVVLARRRGLYELG